MRYPKGQQDFTKIRENGFAYVDKTEVIYNLVNNESYVFLARPRRFGKSLLLSTIKAFFEGRKELFKGLAIETLEKNWKKHPVFLLSLARIKNDSHEALKEGLNHQFEVWENDLNINNSNPDFGSRFSTILIESYKKHGQRAVVLIDEYDNPIINTLLNDPVHEANRILLKSIYSNLKDLDGYIHFGMLTGVSRFSKMTIFSGLNNLTDITFYDRYSTICGFTLPEILEFLKPGIQNMADLNHLSLDDTVKKLKDEYDGYHFSKRCPDIYNPFSVILALDKGEIGPFWLESATPSFLVNLLKHTSLPFTRIFNAEAQETVLSESDSLFMSPVALLFQTGYITIKNFDESTNRYILGVPNREVENGLFRYLLRGFTDVDFTLMDDISIELKNLLLEGRPSDFLKLLKTFIADIPTFPATDKVSEKFFEHTLYLILRSMGFKITSQKITSFSRSDLSVETPRYVYIFELKTGGSPEDALRQIEEKEYDLPFRNSGKKIFKIGLVFSKRKRNLSSWTISS